MIAYLSSVVIYFIIITATAMLLGPMLRRYNLPDNKHPMSPVAGRLVLACIPVFRFLVIAFTIIMAIAPESFVEEVNERARLKEENK